MGEADTQNMVFGHPAAVILRANQAEMGAEAIAHRAVTEDFIKRYNPYFFSAEISNNRLDSHHTRMAVSSLKNYAADAQAGVSFLHSHNRDEILGRSIGGKFVNAQGNGIARVTADFYTVPGLMLGSVSSDQLILGIDTAILNDVSIGFYGGMFVCSICGRDMLRDWDCDHIPGWEEEVEHDGKVEKVIAEATVEDAHLAETSDVFKGSCPGAAIIKAQQEAESGRINPKAQRFIEQRYHIHLPAKRVVVPGHSTPEENREMPQQRNNEAGTANAGAPNGAADAQEAATGDAAPGSEAAGASAGAPPPSTDSAQPAAPDEARLLTQLRSLVVQRGLPETIIPANARLLELAADGAAYREDLIAEALAEGVRTFGAGFDQPFYRDVLERATIAGIKRMSADWTTQGDKVLSGGRRTRDAEPPPPPKRATPRSAFKTRAS